jgi:hypothetical protein
VTSSEGRAPESHRATAAILVAIAVVLIGGGALLFLRSEDNNDTGLRRRQAAVEVRGKHVMPFDQASTTHVFAKTASGGIETVTANDASDANQVALIRMHLEHEAQLFTSGDFRDPAAIHGTNMPGLAQLERGAGHIHFTYAEAPSGATITYRTTDAGLVAALHTWFDAQITDHGTHGQP